MDLITVERYNFKPDWTIGRFLIYDNPVGFTIEDEMRQVKIRGETAIPFGEYDLGFRQSPKFSNEYFWSDLRQILVQRNLLNGYPNVKDFRPHDLIHIKNVPDFEYILFHWGNFDDDTDGCIIGGSSVGFARNRKGEMKEAVLNSRNFYRSVYPQLYPIIKKGGQRILITQVK